MNESLQGVLIGFPPLSVVMCIVFKNGIPIIDNPWMYEDTYVTVAKGVTNKDYIYEHFWTVGSILH